MLRLWKETAMGGRGGVGSEPRKKHMLSWALDKGRVGFALEGLVRCPGARSGESKGGRPQEPGSGWEEW